MKTNASIKTIVAAVQQVSNEMYGGNLVLGKHPESLSKYVNRFTLRTKDKSKAPSILNKDDKPLPRASWDAHKAVIEKIFKIQPQSDIYVDPNHPDHDRFYISESEVDPNYVPEAVILKEQEKEREKLEKAQAKATAKEAKRKTKSRKIKQADITELLKDKRSVNALIKTLQKHLARQTA